MAKHFVNFCFVPTSILIFSGTTLDTKQYCTKSHFCHSKIFFTMCPGRKHQQAEHIECQLYIDLGKNQRFGCLDRSDIGSVMFQKNIFRRGTAKLPNLSTYLDYNKRGFHCDKEFFVEWNYWQLGRLHWFIKECILKNSKKIEAEVLLQLLVTDLSFKGRDFIPRGFINEYK